MPEQLKSASNTSQTSHKRELTYALVGNPNSGKTTLFNNLTGLKQKVANYPGVTVEKKEGYCYSQYGERIQLIDLPGAYSLCAHSPDEEILQQILLGSLNNLPKPDRLMCIVDANNLERTLYLAIQVLELGFPTILVLNRIDAANRTELSINIKQLEKLLGIPIIPTQANKKETLIPLKVIMSQSLLPCPKPLDLHLPGKIKEAVIRIQHALPQNWAFGKTLLLLTGTNQYEKTHPLEIKTLINEWRSLLDSEIPQWRSKIIQSRYALVESIYKQAVAPPPLPLPLKKNLSDHLDTFFLHPIGGWASLICLLCTLFWSIFTLSEYPMNGIQFCIDQLSQYTHTILPPRPIKIADHERHHSRRR